MAATAAGALHPLPEGRGLSRIYGKISLLEGHSGDPNILDGRYRLEPAGSRQNSMGPLFLEFCRGGGETAGRAVDEMNMVASNA